ncbi:MAG: hypothetical protein ABIT71_26580 [Vicinamibacteraceae bacterium]
MPISRSGEHGLMQTPVNSCFVFLERRGPRGLACSRRPVEDRRRPAAYEYLIAGGDGSMYLRWDHQLLRPSDGQPAARLFTR